ncbi:MAG TPA: SDR family oxidoreductase [Rhodocyclaceae bacterium]
MRHALVTGANRGIGAAIADALRAQGYRVSGLSRTAGELPACDVTDAAAVGTAFAAARERHGPIEILVNNAGAAESAPFLQTDDALLDRMLDVNLRGAWHCSRAALPDMQAAGWGRIVNIASIAGLAGYPYVSAYCAAKHALVGLTRALAAELALKPATQAITVNALCPGYTDTDLAHDAARHIAARTGRSEAEALAGLAASNPQGRLLTSAEIAAAVLRLCGEDADAFTGQTLSLSN